MRQRQRRLLCTLAEWGAGLRRRRLLRGNVRLGSILLRCKLGCELRLRGVGRVYGEFPGVCSGIGLVRRAGCYAGMWRGLLQQGVYG